MNELQILSETEGNGEARWVNAETNKKEIPAVILSPR